MAKNQSALTERRLATQIGMRIMAAAGLQPASRVQR
jgi:hypothetical protein